MAGQRRQLSEGYLDDDPDLGPCCNCESTGEDVRNIVMLPRRGPVPGTGWGCLVCNLPMDGAVAVLCDRCVELEGPPKFVCFGNARAGQRFPYAELAPELFYHDKSKHDPDD